MSEDRSKIALVLIVTLGVVYVAVQNPVLIPALALGAAVFMAAALFLKL